MSENEKQICNRLSGERTFLECCTRWKRCHFTMCKTLPPIELLLLFAEQKKKTNDSFERITEVWSDFSLNLQSW